MAWPSGLEHRTDSERIAVTWRAVIEIDGFSYPAEIRNISASGRMVAMNGVVEPEMRVIVRPEGLGDISGTVRWCADGSFGMRFDAPLSIDPETLARYRNPGA